MSEPANENRTHIYRIRRKSDGLFLSNLGYGIAHGSHPGHWSTNGAFWWKPETIRSHLLELCQFRVYCSEGGSIHDMRQRKRGKRQMVQDEVNPFWVIYGCNARVTHVATLYDRLGLYEVIATQISVHAENVMEAADFASFNPIGETVIA